MSRKRLRPETPAPPTDAAVPVPDEPYEPPRESAAPSAGSAPGFVERHEILLWALLVVVAAVLRLVDLGARPFHHDESLHAWFSHDLATKGEYKYDPVYHGPVQYFAVASAFRIFGDTDVTARLPAALGGVVLVLLLRALRPRFGPTAALLSGLLVAVSPSFLYFTRFCREDVWSLLGTAGALLAVDAWSRSRRVRDLAWAAVAAAVAFASKENFYVLLALLGPALLAAWWVPGRGFNPFERVRRTVDVLERHWPSILGALLLFFAASELLYTVFLVHPESANPAFEAISYWYGQHKVQRVGGPPSFYLPRLLQYEFAIFLPALVFLLLRWKTLDAAGRFLGGLGVSSLLMYAYLGEKTPWLVVHQLLPLVPLAALAWAAALASGGGRAVAGLVGTATVVTSLALSFVFPAISSRSDKAESVVYVQTTPEALEILRDVEKAAATGAKPAAAVMGEANWPFSWYLRRYEIWWSLPTAEVRPPVAVVDTDKADSVEAILGPGYERRDVALRAWWIPDVSWKPLQPSPRELLEYLLTRKTWNQIGWQNVTVFRKVGENAAPASPAAPAPANP